MSSHVRAAVIVAAFALVAACGLVVSYSAPYRTNGDELVYLTGELQLEHGGLPDPELLTGLEFGPYLYPKLMAMFYEPLGPQRFKSLYLVFLIFAIGGAGYTMFRLLSLPWLPSLLLSLALLMPRDSSGQEIFGVLTFRGALGRMMAVPLFLFASGVLIRRYLSARSLWPVFFVIGLCVFLHPVTVTLFAFISLVTLAIVMVVQHTSFLRFARDVLLAGTAFVFGGGYFFIEVFRRLFTASGGAAVSASAYASAVVYRNAWEFPAATIRSFPHMLIVSALFIGCMLACRYLYYLRSVCAEHTMPHGRTLLLWGSVMAVAALVLTLVIPGANLYAMEHFGAPYIFQQWSRISKFYYLGLFIALVPTVYALWGWYRTSAYGYKRVILSLLVVAAIASSSYGLEVAEFVFGYPNFEQAYIPQALSGVPDGTSPQAYRNLCARLRFLGGGPHPVVVSGDFALRYYCEADLYVTFEEGSAYMYLPRAELLDWRARLDAQRATFHGDDPAVMRAFARSVRADFVVLNRSRSTTALESLPCVTTTADFVVLDAR